MKKVIELLETVCTIGFTREKALSDIDSCLDEIMPERPDLSPDLSEESISDDLYADILDGFKIEAQEMEFARERELELANSWI